MRNDFPHTTATTIRRATADDAQALTQMLGRAFLADPIAVWVSKASALRRRVLETIDSTRLRELLPHEEVWMTSASTSAALWTPPGCSQTDFAQSIAMARDLLDPQLLRCVPKLALVFTSMKRAHSHTSRHWYLTRLGTDPHLQRLGLASAVMRPALETCDRDGTSAYLDTANERNIDFYRRHGFQTVGVVRIPHGPRIWTMRREPVTRRER